MKPIDFWFSIGSTYTCLTLLRLPAYAETHGVTFTWRPFNVRAILIEQNNSPFPHMMPGSQETGWDCVRRTE
jgi:2-hydroxychromene-2-carboxylate isomerase